MVADLTDSSIAGYPLETLLFGGCLAPDSLSSRVKKAFPTAVMYVDIISFYMHFFVIFGAGVKHTA